MLKIILWRLLYNILGLLKHCGFKGRRVAYFTYGANLDPAVLRRRCIQPLSRREIRLADFKLVFSHEIPFQGAAMASVEACAGEHVPGLIYEIHQIDSWRLDCMEGCRILDRYKKIFHQMPDQPAFYFYATNRAKAGLFPPQAYLEKILRGYALLASNNETFIQALKRTPTLAEAEMVPTDRPYFMLRNYEFSGKILGRWVQPWLIVYDKKCAALYTKWVMNPSWVDGFYKTK